MLAVLVDLERPERRWSGVLVGIAAGPEADPPRLRGLPGAAGTSRAAAGERLLTFVATVALGALVLPGYSATYWTDRLLDAGRVGPPALAHNQSVYGVLADCSTARRRPALARRRRRTRARGPLVAARWWRRGDRLLGTCLARGHAARLADLVVAPLGLGGAHRAGPVGTEPVGLRRVDRGVVARPILWPPYGHGREYGWNPAEHLVGNAYVLAALVLSGWAAVGLTLRRTGGRLPGAKSGTPANYLRPRPGRRRGGASAPQQASRRRPSGPNTRRVAREPDGRRHPGGGKRHVLDLWPSWSPGPAASARRRPPPRWPARRRRPSRT